LLDHGEMKNIRTMFVLFFLTLLPLAAPKRATRYVSYDPPVVYPSKDHVTISARSTYRLTCEGNRPVQWHLPKTAKTIQDRVSISYSTDPGLRRNYTTNIMIKDMVYTDTGSYRCSFNGSDDASGIDANTFIHIYVYDKVHLLTNDDFDFQQFVQYETAVIPCMPTHPNVSVSLELQDKGPILPDNQYVQFNPKVGFLISPVMPEHTGMYTCNARLEDKTSEYYTSIKVLPANRYVPPPHINKTSGEHVTIGQTLVLTCSITVDWSIQVRLRWSVPDENSKMGRLERPSPVSKNVTIGGKPLKVVEQRLVVLRVVKEDQGTYECIVTDHSKNSRAKREFIRIYERDESFLKVGMEGTNTVQKPGGRDETVQWVVNVQAQPRASLTWYDPDDRVIPAGEDSRGRTVSQTSSGETIRSMLRLRGLELKDSGEYRVRVENQFNVKWENFTLIITQPPKVEMMVTNPPDSGLYQLGKLYKLRCSSVGYPRPRIDWTFVKCSGYGKCQKTTENLAHTKEKEIGRFQVDSTLEVPATDSGRYTCIANAGEHAESAAVNFFVTSLKNGFEISGSGGVLEGEKVDVRCGVSKYNYTQASITWYKQTVHGLQEISESHASGMEIYNDRSAKFDIFKGLKFPAIRTADSGTYVCRARTPGHGGPRRRHNLDNTLTEQIQLRVEAYEPPRMHKTNMFGNETLIFGKGEGVTLTCNVGGTHMPQVEWFKDDVKIPVPHNNIKLLDKTQTLSVGVVVETIDEGVYRCEATNLKGRVVATQTIVKVEAPSIHQTNLLGEPNKEENQAKVVGTGSRLVLQCRISGRPRPEIIWTLEGAALASPRVNITDDNQTLIVENLSADDSGRYECLVRNSGGATSVFQNVSVEESSIMATLYATGIAIPVFIAVGVAVILAICLILMAKLCMRPGRWKAPPTPPTPRLTQFDMPEEETESCRLTLSRDGSPFVNGNVCHGCTGCQGSCHQCSGCHYNFNGIYGCTSAGAGAPYAAAMYGGGGNGGSILGCGGNGGSILGVRGCTPGPGYSPGSQVMNEYSMYSQHTLNGSRYNTVKRAAAMAESGHHKLDRRSASPRLSAEF